MKAKASPIDIIKLKVTGSKNSKVFWFKLGKGSITLVMETFRKRGTHHRGLHGQDFPEKNSGNFLTEKGVRRFFVSKTQFLCQFLMDFFLTERGVPPPHTSYLSFFLH